MNTDRAAGCDYADVLATLPLFAGIRKRELRRIACAGEVAEFAPGEMVVTTGAPSEDFYVILGGEAAAPWKPAARRLKLGDYFGEIGLLDGGPRSAFVVAKSELQVLRLPRRAFDDVVERHPTVARRFLIELGSRVRELERQAARREEKEAR
jgi:CRP/FNR family transcriptional regulator, cyclic AMP receptor protein